MNNWIGASDKFAKAVFLLPNQPVLPKDCDIDFLGRPDVSLLIELNGNHWRKIFTIMAKLLAPEGQDWKTFRDKYLFDQVAMCYEPELIIERKGVRFIVGKTFEGVFPKLSSIEKVGRKHQAFISNQTIWTPYLDYRQFPNALIEDIRQKQPIMGII